VFNVEYVGRITDWCCDVFQTEIWKHCTTFQFWVNKTCVIDRQISQKQCISAVLDNIGRMGRESFRSQFDVNRSTFEEDISEKQFLHFCLQCPFNIKLSLPLTRVTKFEVSTAFLCQVNWRHGTEGWHTPHNNNCAPHNNLYIKGAQTFCLYNLLLVGNYRSPRAAWYETGLTEHRPPVPGPEAMHRAGRQAISLTWA